MNLAAIDLNLLVVFDALWRERSVTRAGRRIGLSQPAASNALARLRHLFDDPLFDRGARGMEPTARARALASPVAEILARVEGALREADPFDPATARRAFTLGLTDYGSGLLLPRLASALGQEAPGIELRTRHALGREGLTLLDGGALDLLFTMVGETPARFVRRPVLDERFVVVARRFHPGIGSEGLDLESYLRLPHLLISFSGDVRGRVDGALARRGLKRRVTMTVPHFGAAPFIVGASDLIATVAERIAKAYCELCGLAIYPVPLELPGYTKSLVWRRRDERDAAFTWFRRRVAGLIEEL